MGPARLRCASVLAHRSTVLVPRTLHRSATWELRASAALRCSLTGPPSSFLGRCTALPHGSCAPPLRFGARSPVHRPRSSDAAPLCHMGAARLRCASVLAHRSTVLVPRTLHRSATWELRASAALRCSLTGPTSSSLGRCTALPHGSCAPPLRFGARSYAVGALRLLPRGVGADRRSDDDRLGVDGDDASVDRDNEAVEAAWRGTTLLLAHAVVLRSVARALEPLRGRAPRHTTAEVHAFLVQRHDAGLVAVDHRAVRGDALGLGDRVLRIGVDVEAPLGDVVRLLLVRDLAQDVGEAARTDLRAEAPGQGGPEEGEHRSTEAGEPEREEGDDATVEELPARDAE